MTKDNKTVSPSSSDEKAVDTALSFRAKVCLGVSFALLGVGFVTLTNLYLVFTPLFEFLTDNPSATIRAFFGGIVFVAFFWLSCKYQVIRHVTMNASLFALVAASTYFLSIRPDFTGQPHVTIWAPILMEIGVIALATCFTLHASEPGGILDFSRAFITFQTVLAALLGITYLFFSAEAQRQHFIDVRAHFSSLHVGESSSLPEIIEFQGARFECAMVGGSGKCSYAAPGK